MAWFILSIGSIAFLAGAELAAQKILTRKESLSPTVSAVLGYSLQALMTLPFLLLLPPADRFRIFEADVFIKYIAVVLIGALGAIVYLQSFKVKNISISIIFGSLSVVVSTALGIIFFHESTGLMKFIGIGLILFAIFILNFRNASLEKNHFYGLLSGILYGAAYYLDKSIVQAVHPLAYIFWVYAGLAVCTFFINPIKTVKSLQAKSSGLVKLVVVSSTGFILYNLLTFFSYTVGGEVGKIDAINNSEVFLIVLFEYFILKQKTSIARKLITTLIAFIGVMLLGFYR
jgi:drug/metabolite transporter (DMT)-like permease